MRAHRSALPRAPLCWAAASMLLAMLAAVSVAPSEATASGSALPLGRSGLLEVRTVETLAPGVQLTRIIRGLELAQPGAIPSTVRGPWRLKVLTIDPLRARGHVKATYGADLAQVEKTTDLVRAAGALAGVNASFFAFGKSPLYPGEPVGLGLYRGEVLSEPAAVRPEVDFVVDARTNKVLLGRLTWSGSMTNRLTGSTLRLEYLNHPPVVPRACVAIEDPTTCQSSGDVVHFNPAFGPTPRGPGVEVVLDSSGCAVRTARARGTQLSSGQSSLQATGLETRQLLALTARGCLSRRVALFDENRTRLALNADVYGVAGRYRLTRDGRIVVPAGTGAFFARNPRTIAGTTAGGKILLVTIDGRRSTSVGTTMAETAAVAQSLGMQDAVNLDGGGSTAMSVRGLLVNQPSGSERAVGDALVYVDQPLS